MAEVVLHGTQHLNDQDAQAMAVYLHSLVRNKTVHGHTQASIPVEASSGADTIPTPKQMSSLSPAQLQGGEIYKQHCADCHGENGQGHTGVYPALAGNRALLMNKPNNAVLSVLYGGFAPSTQGNPQPFGMPPFMLELSNAQIAQVLSYSRSAWGNQAAPISELQVQAVRDPQQRR
jgi:mono/diheme cytochrome c family protein